MTRTGQTGKRLSPRIKLRLSRNLVYWRRRRGLTQAQLAFQAGLAENTLARIEAQRADPRTSSLEAAAAVLDIDIRELFAGGLPKEKLPGPE
ncbi:MAG: helix-turn-helix transcriptional regulator [Rhodobacteraceae bacterium]|nr:helix-turn-helix transcriptional regulator [Paracoccaceae bacterium]MCY4141467.1 helix-turn-helix transcriptional regulator [Paracoccaceae bacterium]